jgi:dolichol kinase
VAHNDISYQQEAMRKATHFIALLIPLCYLVLPKLWAIGLMSLAMVVIIAFEIVRLRKLRPWQYLKWAVGGMIRPKEENGNFTGAFYIILGGLATIIFFPRYIAFTAISFEILGDVASAMIGRRYGKHFIRRPKTIEGALGFLAVALLIILLVPKVPYTVGIIGAIVATIVESVSIYRDDNLTVPLISGLVMHLLVLMFPLLP